MLQLKNEVGDGYGTSLERSVRKRMVSGDPGTDVRGAKPHKSNDDPSDPNDVISVRFTDSNGKRVASAHVYEDGNGKVVRW